MKLKNTLVLTVFFFMSCTPRNEKTIKIVTQYFEYFNKHNWEKLANMYSEVSEFKDPSSGSKIITQTREQIIKKYIELSNTFPNIRDKIIAIYPSGDKHIAVEFISKGTAVDSSEFEIAICTIFTIENEHITRDFTYYDNF